MAMQLQKIGRYDVAIFLPDGEYDTVFYSVEVNADAAKRTWEALQAPRYAMVVALGMDWFDDLTPWPAPNVYDGLAPFGGKADALLEYFETELVPQAEAIIGVPAHRGFFGFSLGGLLAVYAFYKSELFTLIGGVCASIWYDGFTDWMCERHPLPQNGSVYFCVGDREHLTKYERMAVTGECMRRATAVLAAQGYSACFELLPGDHLEYIAQRTQRTLDWLMNEVQT